MQKITTVKGLKEAIQILEVKQHDQGKLLKEQIYLAYESLRPVNLIRNTVRELFSSASISENFSGGAMRMASGYLIRKLLVGKSGNTFRKILGSVLEFGLSGLIVQNMDVIRSAGHSIIQYLFSKKKQ
jgi:hypothetical protein